METKQCYCCKKNKKQSDYGGYYCSNSGCPCDGLIDPYFGSGLSRLVDKYQSLHNIKNEN